MTTYEGYPGSDIIPSSCTAQGAEILTGEQYSMNGGTPVGDLAQLGVVPNDARVTMTWTGFALGCENVGISLSRKVAPSANFDGSANQYLNVWSYCGPGGNSCAAVGNTLVLDLAASGGVTCYQLDANAGPPLEIVGPAGAFYGFDNAHNVLLSANNGGTGECAIEPCATAGTPVDMPASAAACEGVAAVGASTPSTAPSTTQAPVATGAPAAPVSAAVTTGAPSAPVSPAVTTGAPSAPSGPSGPASVTTSASPCGAGQTLDAATQQCVAVLPARATASQLPFTGSASADLARFGGAMVLGGLLFVVAARRWRSI